MRLLIVEDDAKLASWLRQGLKEQGFAVDVASTGTEGLGLALVTDYDALLLDLMLPALDGFELLRQLRQRGSAVPVLVVTARSALDDRVRGLDLGRGFLQHFVVMAQELVANDREDKAAERGEHERQRAGEPQC